MPRRSEPFIRTSPGTETPLRSRRSRPVRSRCRRRDRCRSRRVRSGPGPWSRWPCGRPRSPSGSLRRCEFVLDEAAGPGAKRREDRVAEGPSVPRRASTIWSLGTLSNRMLRALGESVTMSAKENILERSTAACSGRTSASEASTSSACSGAMRLRMSAMRAWVLTLASRSALSSRSSRSLVSRMRTVASLTGRSASMRRVSALRRSRAAAPGSWPRLRGSAGSGSGPRSADVPWR